MNIKIADETGTKSRGPSHSGAGLMISSEGGVPGSSPQKENFNLILDRPPASRPIPSSKRRPEGGKFIITKRGQEAAKQSKSTSTTLEPAFQKRVNKCKSSLAAKKVQRIRVDANSQEPRMSSTEAYFNR